MDMRQLTCLMVGNVTLEDGEDAALIYFVWIKMGVGGESKDVM